ncbi:MAG: shikimate kinase [Acidobacteria bacterium]|nr:MAG: shikimate kinase [Acidobacteriota bacterium]REK12127.1 MAG: shikimate kinase [Acidobacteriota bacterium]
MGAGKSTVGRALARRLQWPFVDLDQEIERKYRVTIPRIFSEHGEAGFRQREHEVLAGLAFVGRAVISTGGGTFTFEPSRRLIARAGVSVFLDPDFDLLWQRLVRSPKERPLLADRTATERLWKARREVYLEANLRIDVGADGDPDAVAAAIVQRLTEDPCVI